MLRGVLRDLRLCAARFMTLEHHIEEIRTNLKAGRFSNEAAVSQGVVLRLLQALSWPTFDPQTVCPEYSLEGRRVDFALCHPPGKPIAFIEVKQVGQSEGAERQLFEYAFHAGVPLAILTDGREWSFFLPGEQGNYGERRVYKLDILERDITECTSRLQRYLSYEAIKSGQALDAAREDYRNVSRERQIMETLPKAWQKLVEEEDSILLELIADTVETLCGYKPTLDTVARFIKDRLQLRNVLVQQSELPSARPKLYSPPLLQTQALLHGTYGFTFRGQHFPAHSAREVLTKVIETLSSYDSTFLQRFAALPRHGQKRRYIARILQNCTQVGPI